MDMGDFNQQLVELHSLMSPRLDDPDALSAVVVAAAGAVGMSAHGPPIVRRGPMGITVALLCRDGHIVLHATFADSTCLVDIVARAPADVDRGIEVIARRLTPL